MMRSSLKFFLIATLISIPIATACMRGDNFEQISSQHINQDSFPIMRNVLKEAFEKGFEIDEADNEVILIHEGNRHKFNYPIYLPYLDEDYLIVLTGNISSDAGWRAMVLPTYTRIIVFEKKKLNIIFDKKIYESASKAMIKDEFLYFGYGEYPDLKYGRFPLPE